MKKQRVVGLYYPIEKLRALPDDDQEVYLACCQIINEVGMLAKQMMYAFNFGEDGDLPSKLAQDSMGNMNMRFLAGRTFEGWKFLKQKKKIMRRLTAPEFQENFDADYEILFKLLGHSRSAIKAIRNRYAFHSNASYLRRQLAKHPDDEFIEFIGEQNGNMFFHGTDLIVLNAIIDAHSEDGDLEDLKELQSNIMAAANALTRIAKNLAASIFQRIYSGEDEGKREDWMIDMPDLTKTIAPFFAYLDPDTV